VNICYENEDGMKLADIKIKENVRRQNEQQNIEVLNPLHGRNKKTRRRYADLGSHLKDGSGTGNGLSIFCEEDNNNEVGHL
jgi:hypothetical protein